MFSIKQNCQVFDYLAVKSNPFAPVGQAPIVSSLKGSGAVSYSAFALTL